MSALQRRSAAAGSGPRRAAPSAVRRLVSFVPGLAVLSSYQTRWLRSDVVAGLVLTPLLVPQGVAYAELAELPAIAGLYTSILCLVSSSILAPPRIPGLGRASSL